jgi:hypothetical protein
MEHAALGELGRGQMVTCGGDAGVATWLRGGRILERHQFTDSHGRRLDCAGLIPIAQQRHHDSGFATGFA